MNQSKTLALHLLIKREPSQFLQLMALLDFKKKTAAISITNCRGLMAFFGSLPWMSRFPLQHGGGVRYFQARQMFRAAATREQSEPTARHVASRKLQARGDLLLGKLDRPTCTRDTQPESSAIVGNPEEVQWFAYCRISYIASALLTLNRLLRQAACLVDERQWSRAQATGDTALLQPFC